MGSLTYRMAHLTDIHIREGLATEEIRSRLRQAVDLGAQAFLLGGDTVMNSVSADLTRVKAQWAAWHEVTEEFAHIPFIPCLGNQDIWGWNQRASGCTGQEPLFGKQMFLKQVGLDRTYFARRIGDWRLIVLDSIQRGGTHGFYAAIDPAQLDWLKRELEANTVVPTLIATHIPIVPGPAEFFAADIQSPDSGGRWSLQSHLVHTDSHTLTSLFARFPNVRLCVSGHTHLAQRIEYHGVTYVVTPPLSGAWWRSDYMNQPRGFNILELSEEGSFIVNPVTNQVQASSSEKREPVSLNKQFIR